MENIIELEVVNKSISSKFRQNNYVSAGDVYKFNFSSAWDIFLNDEKARLQVTYLIENGRQDVYYCYTISDCKSIAPAELFEAKYEGKIVYLGICGVLGEIVYPSTYYRLGAIRL